MIKAIFFDWFNTLARYDPPREQMHSEALRQVGVDISPTELMPALLRADQYFFSEASHNPAIKTDLDAKMKFYFHYAEIILGEIGVEANQDLVTRLVQKWPQMFSKLKFVLFDDVLTTLKALKQRRLTLGLLTNATRQAVSVQKELGLGDCIDFTVTAEEAGGDKPQPQIFLKALEKAAALASEAMHVGDQPGLDVAGARGVNIRPVLIDRFELYPDFTECPRIHTLPELVQYI